MVTGTGSQEFLSSKANTKQSVNSDVKGGGVMTTPKELRFLLEIKRRKQTQASVRVQRGHDQETELGHVRRGGR